MCIFGGGQQQQQKPKETPPAAAPADQTDVGSKRKAEDLAMFGGVPVLRTDRSAVSGGVASGGSGLNVMK